MRVVFLDDVPGVALGGEVKEVKNGFARNYLIPQNLAVAATRNALQRVEKLGEEAETNRLKTLQDMKALAELLDGIRIDVEMRAGASGRLYGSVTNTVVAEKIAELTDREIDRRTVDLSEPIRALGTFELGIRVHPEATATVTLLVYPSGSEPDEFLVSLQEQAEAEKEKAAAESEGSGEAGQHVGVVADGADAGTEAASAAEATTAEVKAVEAANVSETEEAEASGEASEEETDQK